MNPTDDEYEPDREQIMYVARHYDVVRAGYEWERLHVSDVSKLNPDIFRGLAARGLAVHEDAPTENPTGKVKPTWALQHAIRHVDAGTHEGFIFPASTDTPSRTQAALLRSNASDLEQFPHPDRLWLWKEHVERGGDVRFTKLKEAGIFKKTDSVSEGGHHRNTWRVNPRVWSRLQDYCDDLDEGHQFWCPACLDLFPSQESVEGHYEDSHDEPFPGSSGWEADLSNGEKAALMALTDGSGVGG